MKRMSIFSVIIIIPFLFNIIAFSQSQGEWIWQNPTPQGNSLYGIHVFNDGEIIAAGDHGTIMRSSDSGESWNIDYYQSDTVKPKFIQLDFVDSKNGWAITQWGNIKKIYYTTDGGYSWEPRTPVTPSTYTGIFALDSLHAWVTGSSYSQRTTDGGLNWTIHFVGTVPNAGNIAASFFLNENKGWCVGNYGTMFQTTDGGVNWTALNSTAGDLHLGEIFFLDENNGWACGENALIMRTTDGGQSWTWQNYFQNPTNYGLNEIYFHDLNNGIAAGTEGLILTTSDGGSSWEIRESTTDLWIWDIEIADNNTIWGCCTSGLIIKSEDGGVTWAPKTTIVTTEHLHQVQFIDENVGWACGTGEINLFKTEDGGETWVVADTGYHPCLIFQFFDSNNGIRIEWYGETFRTRDGGVTWEFINVLPIQYGLYQSGFFTDTSTGWITGTQGINGLIFKTTDGAKNWTQVYTATGDWLYAVFFINSNTGWVAGNNGTILKTTDGGQSWNYQNSTTTETLLEIYFINESTGWIVGTKGLVLKTSDGGDNWSELNDPFNLTLEEVFFFDENNGWISGISGQVAHTSDGGVTWNVLETPVPGVFQAGHFSSSGVIWFVGYGGIIFKYDPNSVSVDESDENLSPSSFVLYQNYPNPFNPATKISWRAPVGSWQTLKIYDILGNEVATLVDEFRSEGIYEIIYNPWELSSGVYFYRLQAGNFSDTKKMILMK